MSKPLVVSIPHQLGQDEAMRRIRDGLVYLRTQHANKVSIIQEDWTDNRLAFKVAILAQTLGGTVDVGPDQATLSVELPWVLAMLADKARGLIEKEGTLLLEKKK